MPAGEMELVAATGIEGPEEEQSDMAILRATGENVDFVGVMSFSGDEDGRISARRIEGLADGLLGVEIVRPDGSKDIVLSAETSCTFEYAGQTITGQVALLKVAPDGKCELVDAAT